MKDLNIPGISVKAENNKHVNTKSIITYCSKSTRCNIEVSKIYTIEGGKIRKSTNLSTMESDIVDPANSLTDRYAFEPIVINNWVS